MPDCERTMATAGVLLEAIYLIVSGANQSPANLRGRKSGAPTRTRTADLLITNQLLYQLSYAG